MLVDAEESTPGSQSLADALKEEPTIYSQESFGDISSKCKLDTESTHKSRSVRKKSEQQIIQESTLPTNMKVQKLWNDAKMQGRHRQQKFTELCSN